MKTTRRKIGDPAPPDMPREQLSIQLLNLEVAIFQAEWVEECVERATADTRAILTRLEGPEEAARWKPRHTGKQKQVLDDLAYLRKRRALYQAAYDEFGELASQKAF